MKYKLLKADYGNETETVNDEYSINITLGLMGMDGLTSGIGFSKDIVVTSHNSQTGFQVDAQREKAIVDFCAENEIEIPQPNMEEIE
jgi:phospholipase C